MRVCRENQTELHKIMRIIIEEDVEGWGKVTAKELTVAELDQLLFARSASTPGLDRLLARHEISAAALNCCLGLDLTDATDKSPSEIVKLVELFRRANPDFFLTLEYEKSMVGIEELLRSLQPSPQKTPATASGAGPAS